MSGEVMMATAGRNLEEMARIVDQMQEDGAVGEHMKAMWAGQSNILVAVRVRPLMKHDSIKKSCIRVLDGKVVIVLDPAAGDKQDILRANRSREKQYAFDFVFEPGSSQECVYHHTSKFLIHGVLDGYNATVFAYGCTGAGKTYTMIGSTSEPGIMVRIMDDLFLHAKHQGDAQGVLFKVTVAFLEVYNENIRDLLSETEEYLDLREDPIAGPTVAGITEVETKSSSEIMNLLHKGNARRTQQPTAANEVSSRSHAVLSVVVECKDRAPGTVANIKVGKLSLVDLAGSERAANTKNRGIRLVEGANINRSLLALGNCINALGEKGNKGNFVPYRDSKLTRLLKDSLGGNCRTVMIANISPAESTFEETLNTLKYANRAKNIKTNVQRNVLSVNHHISEYVALITNLRSEIKILKDQISQQSHINELEAFPMQRQDSGVQVEKASQVTSGQPPSPLQVLKQPSTPLQALRDSMRSAASLRSAAGGEGREYINEYRQRIVENFQERMQLRRSLIELEDQNVQNSIEVSKRQLLVVQWSEHCPNLPAHQRGGLANTMSATVGSSDNSDFSTAIMAHAPTEVKEAWFECEQLRKGIHKNQIMKKNIAKRLRNNERDAEQFRAELSSKITGDDRKELMELQYQVGKLELENMELEQHKIVHDSILKGKDLTIHKLRLQLSVKDKIIKRQKNILEQHNLSHKVGYAQLAALENALTLDTEEEATKDQFVPPSPPKQIGNEEFSPITPSKKQPSAGIAAKQGSPFMKIAPFNPDAWGNPANSNSPLRRKILEGHTEESDENEEGAVVVNKGGSGGNKQHRKLRAPAAAEESDAVAEPPKHRYNIRVSGGLGGMAPNKKWTEGYLNKHQQQQDMQKGQEIEDNKGIGFDSDFRIEGSNKPIGGGGFVDDDLSIGSDMSASNDEPPVAGKRRTSSKHKHQALGKLRQRVGGGASNERLRAVKPLLSAARPLRQPRASNAQMFTPAPQGIGGKPLSFQIGGGLAQGAIEGGMRGGGPPLPSLQR